MYSYEQNLQRLYTTNLHHGMKLGLRNIQNLNTLLGYPYRHFHCIHIAGSNGKGSVAAKIAKGLKSCYSKVGLFTSPHISCFRERIQINSQKISERNAAVHLDEIFSVAERENIPATFFELTTQLAFQHFANEKVDIAVLETGLGGRLDATNIVSPLLTVITSIHLEHKEILGNTLEKISSEKAGILKPGVPAVLGPSACHISANPTCPVIKVSGPFPNCEEENCSIARNALEFFNIPERHIAAALSTRLPCRRETVRYQSQEVILDVAHNPEALKRLFQAINIPQKELRVLCGLGKAKDHQACLEVIDRHAQHIHLVDAPNGRCAAPETLQQVLVGQGKKLTGISAHKSIEEGLSDALHQAATRNQRLLVCGSFFIMCEARKRLGIEEPRDPYDMNEKF